jgi:acyl carrier protein
MRSNLRLAALGPTPSCRWETNNMLDKSNQQKLILRIAEIIIDELKLEDVTAATFDPDLHLVDELGIDSMDLATIALILQDEYQVRIDEDDYPKLTTVRLIAEYIEEKRA